MSDEKLTIGIVLFDKAEELDWVGPFEVFTMAREVSGGKARRPGSKSCSSASRAAS